MAQVVGSTRTTWLDELREKLQRVPAAAQQRHHHAQHDAQAAGLTLGLHKGAQGGAQRRGGKGEGASHDHRQAQPGRGPS